MTYHNQKQSQALEFIRGHLIVHGYPPTRREIAEALGMRSASTAQLLINKMIEEGLIETTPGISRSVVITGTNMKHGEQTV